MNFDHSGKSPKGFDVVSLPKAEYLVVQGVPFKEEEYAQAILSVQYSLEKYDPVIIDYKWNK